jgi:hypothetical protein
VDTNWQRHATLNQSYYEQVYPTITLTSEAERVIESTAVTVLTGCTAPVLLLIKKSKDQSQKQAWLIASRAKDRVKGEQLQLLCCQHGPHQR